MSSVAAPVPSAAQLATSSQQLSEKDQQRLTKVLTAFAVVEPFAERARQNIAKSEDDGRIFAVTEDELRDFAELCSTFWREITQQHKQSLCHNMSQTNLVKAFGAALHIGKCKFQNVTYTEFAEVAEYLYASKFFHFVETLLDEKRCLVLSPTEESGRNLYAQTCALASGKRYDCMDWLSQSYAVFCDAALRSTVLTVTQAGAYRNMLDCLRLTCLNATCARDFIESEPVAYITRVLSGLKIRFQRRVALPLLVDYNASTTMNTLSATTMSLQADPDEFHQLAINVAVVALLTSKQLSSSGIIQYLCSMLYSHLNSVSEVVSSLTVEQATIPLENLVWITRALRDLYIGQATGGTTNSEKDTLLRELSENNFLASVLMAMRSLGRMCDDRHEGLLCKLMSDITDLCSLGGGPGMAAFGVGSSGMIPLCMSSAALAGSAPSADHHTTPSDGPSPHVPMSIHIPSNDEMIALGVTPKMKLSQAKDKVLNFLSSAIGTPGDIAVSQVPPPVMIGTTPPLSPALHSGTHRSDWYQSQAQVEFLQHCVSLVSSLMDLCVPSSAGPLPSVAKRSIVMLVANTIFSSGDLFRKFDGSLFCTKLLQLALAAQSAAAGETGAIDLCSSVDSGSEVTSMVDMRIEDCVFSALEHVLLNLRMPATVENTSLLQRMAKRQSMTAVAFRRVWLLWNNALTSVLQSPIDSNRKEVFDLCSSAHKVVRYFMLSMTQVGTGAFASPVRAVGSIADELEDGERAAMLAAEDAAAKSDEDKAFSAFLQVFATLTSIKSLAAQPQVPEAIMRGLSVDNPRLRSVFNDCLMQLIGDKNPTAVSVCATAVHDAGSEDVQLVSSLLAAFVVELTQLQKVGRAATTTTLGTTVEVSSSASRANPSSLSIALPSPAGTASLAGSTSSKRTELDTFRRQIVECDFIQSVIDRVCRDLRTLCLPTTPEKMKQLVSVEVGQAFQLLSIFESRYDKVEENIVRLRQLQLAPKIGEALDAAKDGVTDDTIRLLGQCLLDAATSNYGDTAAAAAPFMTVLEPFAVRQLNCHADKTVFLDLVPSIASCKAPSVPNLILAATKVIETTGNIESSVLLAWVKASGRTDLLAFLQLPVKSLRDYLPLEGDPHQLKKFWAPLLKLAPKRSAIRFHSSGGIALTIPSVPERGLTVSFWMYVDTATRCIPLFNLRGTGASQDKQQQGELGTTGSSAQDHALTVTLEDFDTVFVQDGVTRTRTPVNEVPIHAFCEKKWVQYTLVLVSKHSLRVNVQGRPCGSVDFRYFAAHSKLSVHLGFVGVVQDGQRVFSLADVQVWGDELSDAQTLSDHCHSNSDRHSFKILSSEVPRELSPETPKVPVPYEGRLASFHANWHTGSSLLNTLSSQSVATREISADIVGNFSPLSSGYLDYHTWFATRGGLKLLLKWLEVAFSDGDMESAIRLFSETVRSVSVAEVIRARLYALAAFHLKTNARYLSEGSTASLIRLLSSQAIVGKVSHGIVINKMACDHIVSDVGILSRMRTSVAVQLLRELQKLFDVQANKFARRNASFVVGIRFVVKLIHGIAEHEVMCSTLQREILQLVKKVTQATEFQLEIVQALTSFAAMIVPTSVSYASPKDPLKKILIPVVRGFTRQQEAMRGAEGNKQITAPDPTPCGRASSAESAAPGAAPSAEEMPGSFSTEDAEEPFTATTDVKTAAAAPYQQPKPSVKERHLSSVPIENSSSEFSQLNMSVTFAKSLSRNILGSLVEFELSKEFTKSLAQVVDVPWFLACIERFAHPAAVVYATRLFFEAVPSSPALQESVKIETGAIVESLRLHSSCQDVLLVLLASAFGISTHIRMLSKARSFGQQLDDVIGSVKLEPHDAIMPILAGVLQHHVNRSSLTRRLFRPSRGGFFMPSASGREVPLRMRRVFNVALLVAWWVRQRAAAASKATSCTVSRLGSVEPPPTDPIAPDVAPHIAEFGDVIESPLANPSDQYEDELHQASLHETVRPGDAQRRLTQVVAGASNNGEVATVEAPSSLLPAVSKQDLTISLFEPVPQYSAAALRDSPSTPQTQRAGAEHFKDTLLALRLFQKMASDINFFVNSTTHVVLLNMYNEFLSYCVRDVDDVLQDEDDEDALATSGQLSHTTAVNDPTPDMTSNTSLISSELSLAATGEESSISAEVAASKTQIVDDQAPPMSALDLDDDDDGPTEDATTMSGTGGGLDDDGGLTLDDDDTIKISLGSTSCESVAQPLPIHLQLLVEDVQMHAVPIVTLLIRSSLSVRPRLQEDVLEARYGTTGRLLFQLLGLSRDPNHSVRVAVTVICDAAEELFHHLTVSQHHRQDESPMRLKHQPRPWTTKTAASILASQGPVGIHLPNLVQLVALFADRVLVSRNRGQLLESVEPLLILLHRRWPKRGSTQAETAAFAIMLGDLRDETIRLCLSALCDENGNPGEDLPIALLEGALRVLQVTLSRDFTTNYRVEQMLRLYYVLYRQQPSETSEHSEVEHKKRIALVTGTLRFIVRVYKTSAGGGKENVLRHALSSGLINRRESVYNEFTEALLYTATKSSIQAELQEEGAAAHQDPAVSSLAPVLSEAFSPMATAGEGVVDSPKHRPEQQPAAASARPGQGGAQNTAADEDAVFHNFMSGEFRVPVDMIMSKRPKSKFDQRKKREAQRFAEFKKHYDSFKATWIRATPEFGNRRRSMELQDFYKSHSSGVVEPSNVSVSNLHWLTFHEVSRLLTANSATNAQSSSPSVGHYLDPKRNVVPFERVAADNPIAAIDSAISEHLTGHVSTHIPQMMCRCPPYVGDESFISKLNPGVTLTRSGMRAIKFLLYPNESVRYVCNAFRSSGLTITPCLLILTDVTLKLVAYSCITSRGDVLLNAFELFRSGNVTEATSAASSLPESTTASRRRSGFFSNSNAGSVGQEVQVTKEPERVSMRSKSRSMIAHAASKIRRVLLNLPNDDDGKASGALYSQSILSLHGGQDKGTEGLCWFFNVSSITRVQNVAFLQQDAGLSISMLFEDGPMLAIMDANHSMNAEVRNTLAKELGKLLKGQSCEFIDDNFLASKLSEVVSQWSTGIVSNYEYLLHVNRLAGRLRKDLNQYPVFPWVLADYNSSSLDLEDLATFRDLSFPIGAQTPGRREELALKFESLIGDETTTPFHFGTHYSSAGGVLYYLLRTEPYRTLAVDLQGGDYDHAARLFHSVAEAFASCTTSSTDCKELIPEFYSLSHFLRNRDHLDLGARSDAQVDNVCLPPWSQGMVDVFITVMRQALESPIVSRNLPHWLDLIFGVKQTGEQARFSMNVFQRMTYRAEVNRAMNAAADAAERDAVVAHADNFGQTPRQLFTDPHPMKRQNAFSRIAAILHYGSSDRSRFFIGPHLRVRQIPPSVQQAFGTESAIVTLVQNPRSGTIMACPARAIAVPDENQLLCWHGVESLILRHSADTGDFVSAVQFQAPFQGVEFIECLYSSRAEIVVTSRSESVGTSRTESVVIAGMSTGMLYAIYPDAVRQWNVVGATLEHHRRPIAGMAVSEYLSRMITFTRRGSDSARLSSSSSATLPQQRLQSSTGNLFGDGVTGTTEADDEPDPPMVWRLTKLFVSAMHVLDTSKAFQDAKSDVVAAVIDDRDSSSIVASSREVAVFDACGTLRGVGQLPSEIRGITSIVLDNSREWAGGRSIIYTGHQDGSIALWLLRALTPPECSHTKTVTVQYVAVVGLTAASPVTAMVQEPITHAPPTPGAATILLELVIGHRDGTVSTLQCIDTKIEE